MVYYLYSSSPDKASEKFLMAMNDGEIKRFGEVQILYYHTTFYHIFDFFIFWDSKTYTMLSESQSVGLQMAYLSDYFYNKWQEQSILKTWSGFRIKRNLTHNKKWLEILKIISLFSWEPESDFEKLFHEYRTKVEGRIQQFAVSKAVRRDEIEAALMVESTVLSESKQPRLSGRNVFVNDRLV